MKPLCFILMPFGIKKDDNGNDIDFDKIYFDFIKPSVIDAGLDPIRADEEKIGGIIHKPMYERLMLCEYAIADISTANANVFYELGIRHAVRPHTTIPIFTSDTKIPFDVNFLRAVPYERELSDLENLKKQLTDKILDSKSDKYTDSPLFQLLDGLKPFDIEHEKSDIFREQVKYSSFIKAQLQSARESGSRDELHSIQNALGNLNEVESGILVDLFLSYRSVESFDDMIDLVSKIPKPLGHTAMIQEMLGFALNRKGSRKEAIIVLEEVIKKHGKNSETCGILGRVYKDLYYEALQQGEQTLSEGFLKKAIDTYLDGFESDFRDAYPGINTLTLMDIAGDKRFDEIYPVVLYAVKQKMKNSSDYWDYATLLELYVLKNDRENADEILSRVLVNIKEPWEPKTTVNNLALIKNRRELTGDDISWIDAIMEKLS